MLKEEHGPWVIIAFSFNGVNAQKQAHDLVLELRKATAWKPSSTSINSIWTIPTAMSQSRYASQHKHTYHMFTEHPDAYRDGAIKEFAVIVGNFPAIDDADAQKVLQKLKSADPECLRVNPEERSLAEFRMIQAQAQKLPNLPKFLEGRKQTGPMAHAFITPNPLLPEDYFIRREAWTNWS